MLLSSSDPKAIEEAAERLGAGELVAFPTETVYGLGARADSGAAVAKVFQSKGRPANHPLIVHVADAAQIEVFATVVPAFARRLVDAFWPGPLTLILPRLPSIGAEAAGHQNSVGLRCPAHPVARALLAAALARGVPGVAAPSANRFGRISPTCAAHVISEFGDAVTVLDGGASSIGIESAIVDCSRGHPVLLRPGMLNRAQIEAAAGEPLRAADADAPRAAGTLTAHYAPEAKLRLMPSAMLHTALQVLGEPPLKLAVYSCGGIPAAVRGIRHRRMPLRPDEVAHELFAVLREFDAEGMELIWVEAPPEQPEWDGVRDRLTRASSA
jgi:L-threonylcarbamoyladenylate synthase